MEAVIAPPSPIIVYQTPGADGLKAVPHLGAWTSMVAPSEVDPDKTIPAPGVIGPKASSQKSKLSTICSSKDSRVVKLLENVVEVTSNRYSTPLSAVHATVLDKDAEEPP